MEGPLALFDSEHESLFQNFKIAVIGQLEIIDAGHNTWKVVIRSVRGLARFADNREHWRETLETFAIISHNHDGKISRSYLQSEASDYPSQTVGTLVVPLQRAHSLPATSYVRSYCRY
jgi:hypothetical protein